MQPIGELDYTLVETGGTGGINGGIMKPKRGPWPAKLAFYIDVDDLDAYGKKIKQAGGKISGAARGCAWGGTILAVRGPGWQGARDVEATEIGEQ